MCALLLVTSAESLSYSYWAHIPNPPLLEPVMWGASSLLVYTTPQVLSPPWDNLTANNFAGEYKFNFTYSGLGHPICLGPPPCLSMAYQHWLLSGINVTRSQMQLQKLSAYPFNQTW